MTKKLQVIHKPAGYEGHKDQVPIRSANWKAIFIMGGLLVSVGFLIASGLFLVPPLFAAPATPTPPSTLVALATDFVSPTNSILVSVSSPMPTNTPTPSPTLTSTPTSTPSPTIEPTIDLAAALQNLVIVEVTSESVEPNELELTIAALDERLNSLAVTPDAIFNANAGIAIVSVNVGLIRFLPGTGHRAMKAVTFGTELRLTGESRDGWYAVFYEGGIGWIYGGIIRIEQSQ